MPDCADPDCECQPREQRADRPLSMPDGSYPLTGCTGKDSVKSAALLAHHSKTYSFDQIKAHVMTGMKKFNCPDSVLPESWGEGPEQKSARPPRDNLVRGVMPFELRDSGNALPTLHGHFAVFNRWTEIDSFWEGRFLERIAPGAFARTFKNGRPQMRCLFQHGKDPQIGDKPLGRIDVLEEDDTGAHYEVPLLDTPYNRDLLPGLQEGLYGASFRFRVVQEEFNKKPECNDWNPEGIPERTVKEAQVMEFGPVTFPAYSDATAGVRSLTDDFIVRQLIGEPERLFQLLNHYRPATAVALPPGPESSHSEAGTRDDPPQRGSIPIVRNPNKKRSQ